MHNGRSARWQQAAHISYHLTAGQQEPYNNNSNNNNKQTNKQTNKQQISERKVLENILEQSQENGQLAAKQASLKGQRDKAGNQERD